MSRAVEGGLPLGTCPLGNRVPEEGSVEWNVSAVRPCRADTATQLRCARAVQTRPLSCGAHLGIAEALARGEPVERRARRRDGEVANQHGARALDDDEEAVGGIVLRDDLWQQPRRRVQRTEVVSRRVRRTPIARVPLPPATMRSRFPQSLQLTRSPLPYSTMRMAFATVEAVSSSSLSSRSAPRKRFKSTRTSSYERVAGATLATRRSVCSSAADRLNNEDDVAAVRSSSKGLTTVSMPLRALCHSRTSLDSSTSGSCAAAFREAGIFFTKHSEWTHETVNRWVGGSLAFLHSAYVPPARYWVGYVRDGHSRGNNAVSQEEMRITSILYADSP